MAEALKLGKPSYHLAVGGEPYHWVIIGAGGTGGWFIPQLARQIYVVNKGKPKTKHHVITIVEKDEVEEKNLARQNFLLHDVHKNKGTALADKLRRAFGIEINVVEEYLNSEELLESVVSLSSFTPVIVGCVDNVATRVIIDSYVKGNSGKKKMFWLDSGNDEFAGQVVLTCNVKELLDEGNTKPHIFQTPSVFEIYPDMTETDDKRPDQMSCAEHAISNPQCVAANTTAANELFKIANIMLTSNGTKGVKYHATAFDCEGASVLRLNTPDNLKVKKSKVKKVEVS